MAKVALRTDGFCVLSRHTKSQASIFFHNSPCLRFSSHHHSESKISCKLKGEGKSLKEERPRAPGLVLDGPPEKKLERVVPSITDEFKDESGSGGEVVLSGEWPPWKNVPRRYKLIGTTSLAFVICNMDKVNLSVAIIPMSHQFGWNSSVAGLVQSSFFLGYALSQLPGGWLAKFFGGRKVLEVGVLVWSFSTALVPFVAGYMPGLLLSRILVGIGEGVSPSAATDLIARSIPLEERSRAVSFVFGGLSVGSVLGLLLAPQIIQNLGWESVFYLFGFLGIVWQTGISKRSRLISDVEEVRELKLNFYGFIMCSSLIAIMGTCVPLPSLNT